MKTKKRARKKLKLSSEEMTHALRAACKAGLTVREIADQMGRTPNNVALMLKRRGLRAVPARKATKSRKKASTMAAFEVVRTGKNRGGSLAVKAPSRKQIRAMLDENAKRSVEAGQSGYKTTTIDYKVGTRDASNEPTIEQLQRQILQLRIELRAEQEARAAARRANNMAMNNIIQEMNMAYFRAAEADICGRRPSNVQATGPGWALAE